MKKNQEAMEAKIEAQQEKSLRLKQALPDGEARELAEIFKVLGDPTRLRLLSLLIDNELCVCDIAAALDMGQSAISHQLRVLRNARLVKFRRDGKEAWYSLDDDHVLSLMSQGMEHISHG